MHRLAIWLIALALLAWAGIVRGEDREWRGGEVYRDRGPEVQIDLPLELRTRNRAGRPTATSPKGDGCCTFASLGHQARQINCRPLFDVLDAIASKEAGGGWPERMTETVQRFTGSADLVVHYEGPDPLPVVKLALRTGRMVGVTYGYSDNPIYGGTSMGHMVNAVHCDGGLAAVLDNNDPTHLAWMSEAELKRRICWSPKDPAGLRWGDGDGWVMVLLCPPPPPVPTGDRRSILTPTTTPAGRGDAVLVSLLPARTNPMRALILATLIGQCAGSQCLSAPALESHAVAIDSVSIVQAETVTASALTMDPERRSYRVRFEGREYDVTGQRRSDGKVVTLGTDGRLNAFDLAPEPTPQANPSATLKGSESTPKATPRPARLIAQNFGLSFAQRSQPTPPEGRWHAEGSKARAFQQAVQGGVEQIVDDTDKPHVTVLSPSEPERLAAKSRVDRVAGDRALVQEYDPAQPMVKGLKLWRGKPEIVVQRPDGPRTSAGQRAAVVCRLPIGADDEQIAAALRRADPSYNPNLDPTDPAAADGPDSSLALPVLAAAGVVVVAILILAAVAVLRGPKP